MKDKRILFVSSEVVPYLPETELSSTSFNSARNAHSKGVQTRIFMPRFGVINERRHQLHEVIRLSGMNLVVNDVDMPLIIKVASIPRERMQVYFIDNEEYFKRKAVFSDEDDELFSDNDERAIFFTKGVVETVKKLNWAPDIIHVHGWMTSILPLYLKEHFKEEPLFNESKIITSLYNSGFEGSLNKDFSKKVMFDIKDASKIKFLETPNYENLLKCAIENSDGVIHGSETISDELSKFLETKKIPVLEYGLENQRDAYLKFYTDLISES